MSEAKYWRQHERGTVRFEVALRSVYGAGCRAYVKIDPQPEMLEMAGVCLTTMTSASGSSTCSTTDTMSEQKCSPISIFLS